MQDDMPICHRLFSKQEKTFISTHRELLAIEFSIEAFGPLLRDSSIKWYTDNLPTVRIVEVGSMNMSLHRLAVNIFDSCVNNNIHLAIEWIPRTMNQKADMISKLVDTDDWQILSDFFILIDRLWGPHTVDCFATYYNKKINRFFSRYWNPGTFGVDAFFQSWKNENCLLVPPPP